MLTKDDWLRLWDNIFSNHPSFPLFVVVAYLIANRQTLLSTSDIDDFKVFENHILGPDYMRVLNPGVEFQPTLPS